ncbi:MAG: hypothetical protein U0271_27700 [Polyangiaceae bacterium]
MQREDALQTIFRALRTGRLELWKEDKPDASLPTSEPAESPVVARSRLPHRELTWIEVELIDEEGEPVPNQRYTIEFQDGSPPVSGRLDGKGLAFVSGIPAGKCSFTFPEYDEHVWELIATSPSPRSSR